jgi:hypothetical protein
MEVHPMADPITAVATLLSQIFGFAVDPDGFEGMKLEHQIEVIHAGIQVARSKGDTDALDALFERYRELSKRAGS